MAETAANKQLCFPKGGICIWDKEAGADGVSVLGLISAFRNNSTGVVINTYYGIGFLEVLGWMLYVWC